MPGWITGVLAAAVLMCGVSGRQAWGLGMETHGNEQMSLGTFSELNPVANHDSRVYAYWVNGRERLFYRGDAGDLNEVLERFAAAPLEQHVVVLRPGPCTTNDFRKNVIAYDWHLDIIGGDAAHQTTLDKGELFWPKLPVLTVCVDKDRLMLSEITIPDGVVLLQISDLRERYLAGLESKDTSVRGWGSGILARLDPFSEQNAQAVANVLNDGDDWVRLNAAGAIATYGATAKPLLPRLRELLRQETAEPVQQRLAESIATIEAAEADPEAVARHQSLIQTIAGFVRNQSDSTQN